MVILRFYFLLSAAVLLFGAELNAVLLRRREKAWGPFPAV